MSRAYGANALLLAKREKSYGQRPNGNYLRMPFNSCSLGSEQGLIEDPVLGYGRDPSPPMRDVISDEGDIVIPMDPRYIGIWLTGLLGSPKSTAVLASGFIDFTMTPMHGDTITLNGTTFTFVQNNPSTHDIQTQSTISKSIDEAVKALNSSKDVHVMEATYSRPSSTNKLLVTYNKPGAIGNAFTLAASTATVSASALTGGGYTHQFISGKTDIPSYTLEAGMPEVPAWFCHTGVKFNSVALEFSRSGPASATINAIARGEDRFDTSRGGTPTSLPFTRISQFQGAIKRNDSSVANLTAGSLNYSNNLEKIETIRNDRKIDGIDPTIASLTGRIDVRFADTSLIDLASNGTPVDLEFSYTIDANSSIRFIAHEVHLPKAKLGIEGPGGIQASFEFQGARNEKVGRMLTVMLQNDLDGSQYK